VGVADSNHQISKIKSQVPKLQKQSHIEMTNPSVNKNQRKISLISGSAAHFFHDGIADGLAIFLPLWQASFGLSLTQVGLLVTCFDGATGFFQIPAGFLGERFGERTLLVLGTLITATSFMFMGLVGGLISFVALLFIGGLGAAVQHPLASSMVSKAYNDDGRRVALGTYNFSGDVGKFLFPALGAVLLSQIGWRLVCVGFALSLLFIGGAVGKLVCGALAERIGIIATVVITEGITGCGILLLTVLPLAYIYLFLPVLGVALNGTSSVLYGTVVDFVDRHRVARAFGLFYTFVIAVAAVAPPIMGRVSDILGVDDSVRMIGWIALSTLPMAIVLSRQMIKLSSEK
jgi:MFS family permease